MAEQWSAVGVIGLGSMGQGIATSLARAGMRVIGVEVDARVRARCEARPEGERIELAASVRDLRDCACVIEAVPEWPELKAAVLREAATVTPARTVLVTTTLVARTAAKASAARDALESSLTRSVRRGRITAAARDAAVAQVVVAHELPAVAECDVIVEAVVEEMPAKEMVFKAIDPVAKATAILATCTSSLSVADCAAATERPGSVLGLHFFNPAPIMRLVEITPTPQTDPEALAAARSWCGELGKTGVLCPDLPGFAEHPAPTRRRGRRE